MYDPKSIINVHRYCWEGLEWLAYCSPSLFNISKVFFDLKANTQEASSQTIYSIFNTALLEETGYWCPLLEQTHKADGAKQHRALGAVGNKLKCKSDGAKQHRGLSAVGNNIKRGHYFNPKAAQLHAALHWFHHPAQLGFSWTICMMVCCKPFLVAVSVAKSVCTNKCKSWMWRGWV